MFVFSVCLFCERDVEIGKRTKALRCKVCMLRDRVICSECEYVVAAAGAPSSESDTHI